jgi:hypothetical protein
MKATVEGVLFYLGLGLLFSHELDAIVQSEWRLLYILRSMADEQAMPVFIALHVPLFALTCLAYPPQLNARPDQLSNRVQCLRGNTCWFAFPSLQGSSLPKQAGMPPP